MALRTFFNYIWTDFGFMFAFMSAPCEQSDETCLKLKARRLNDV